MISFPSVINDLARDSQLGGRDMQLWVIAAQRLEFVEFRELPLGDMAEEFGAAISLSTICRSLQRMVQRGYLERALENGRRRTARYRLPLRRVYPPRA